jgi:hypothetical protein
MRALVTYDGPDPDGPETDLLIQSRGGAGLPACGRTLVGFIPVTGLRHAHIRNPIEGLIVGRMAAQVELSETAWAEAGPQAAFYANALWAFTRCRAKAGYGGTAGSRRTRGRRRKAPSAPTATIQVTYRRRPHRATRLPAHRSRLQPQSGVDYLNLWTCYPQVQTTSVTSR